MKYLENGNFILEDFEKYNYLYFPLCNHYGLKSSITPTFNGDLKLDQHHFALPPSSNVDLLNQNNARNVFFKVNDALWSITGNTIFQKINPDKTCLEGGFLYQKVTRESKNFKVCVTSFIPELKENMEMHKVVFENISKQDLEVVPCVAVPIYGRSADNIRDHRHVTSLLNRVYQEENTIYNEPTLSFDERGHNKNEMKYQVLVTPIGGKNPEKYYRSVDAFIGEGGSFMEPKSLICDDEPCEEYDGYECLAGFKYSKVVVAPNEKIEVTFAIAITPKVLQPNILENFDHLLQDSQKTWAKYFDYLSFDFAQNTIMKWVSIQPVLRRIYGCSFLPHHDYGKGGKGWRDLWQDCLALIKMDPNNIRDLLLNNFKGVRIDGSNATIIGDKPGEFKADRNNISRMWMDHGAWPFITLNLYLENTLDYDILFEQISYFKDSHISFSKEIDSLFSEEEIQKTVQNDIYQGSVLEHILVENIPIFFNVGAHNNYKIMGADWNDGLDMADENGESVAFTFLYAKNLLDIAHLLQDIKENTIEVFEEFAYLLSVPYRFEDIEQKNTILNHYFASVAHHISGNRVLLDKQEVIDRLMRMYQELSKHLNENEWLENEDYGYFNSYYDNNFNPLDNIQKKDMLLTGQVFAVMSYIASPDQVAKIVEAADQLLYNKNRGGYLLNTNFNEVKMNMGRLFGFAYGHKENGAMFSHMAVMYANALYQRGFVLEGHKVIQTIFDLIADFSRSKVYPSIPEYFDPHGRGMYPYLTGSASWLILTIIDLVFGIKIENEKLVLVPKLCLEEFKNQKASIRTKVLDKKVNITYVNEKNLEYGQYFVREIFLNNQPIKDINIYQLKDEDELVVILND